jgi:uncharacterized protein (TIGR03905 family)
MKHEFITNGVCSRKINFEINEDGKITNVSFLGGCNGNLKAIARLVEGQEPEKVIELLEGNTCGMRNTSCADQFTKGLREALLKEGK